MISAGFLATLLCFCLGVQGSLDSPLSSAIKGPSAQKRQDNGYDPFYHDCMISGYRYRHGEVFTIPGYSHCLRYRCNRGGWSIYSEACEVDNRCHRVGSYFERGCKTYRCDKEDRGDYNYYRPTVHSTRCEDANHQCRGQHETFSKVIRGVLYDRCQCIVSSSGHIRYSCGSHTPRRH